MNTKGKLVLMLVSLLLLVTHSYAKPKTSRYEFWWSVAHPFAAMKVKNTYKKVYPLFNDETIGRQLDTFSVNGKLDAFRHVFYMAAFAQKVKAKKLVKLGKAHERTNYLQFKKDPERKTHQQDSISCEMDLKNNLIGIQLGVTNKKASLQELKAKAIELVQTNNAHYILRDRKGKYIDCNNATINIQDYNGKWYIPLCMTMVSGIHVDDAK